jgi:hypothetical protein
MREFFKRFSRRTIALFWLIVVGALITTLLAFEQIAILYVLATVTLVVLLLTVAHSNLEDVDRDSVEGFAPDKK